MKVRNKQRGFGWSPFKKFLDSITSSPKPYVDPLATAAPPTEEEIETELAKAEASLEEVSKDPKEVKAYEKWIAERYPIMLEQRKLRDNCPHPGTEWEYDGPEPPYIRNVRNVCTRCGEPIGLGGDWQEVTRFLDFLWEESKRVGKCLRKGTPFAKTECDCLICTQNPVAYS